jgi:hypothetical protein
LQKIKASFINYIPLSVKEKNVHKKNNAKAEDSLYFLNLETLKVKQYTYHTGKRASGCQAIINQ